MMNIFEHNKKAWNRWAENGIEWSIPASPEVIAAARKGEWQVLLTEAKPVPREWFEPYLPVEVFRHGGAVGEPVLNRHGRLYRQQPDFLCLASGGGQQGPILAAAGANVTVFDASPEQLRRDRLVADRDGLELKTVLGDMRDLSAFASESFDLVFHPVSNVFVPEVLPVWREAYRVLRRGGLLLAGIVNPVEYIFDQKLVKEQGIFQVKYALPYSDVSSITEEERNQLYGEVEPLEFSHTLEEQIGGQIEAGFTIIGFYESYRANAESTATNSIAKFMPSYIATRARK